MEGRRSYDIKSRFPNCALAMGENLSDRRSV